MTSIAPEFDRSAFNCPLCMAYAKQNWRKVYWIAGGAYSIVGNLHLATCDHCEKFSVWLNASMVFPPKITAPSPHPDTPEKIKPDFEEARAVFGSSPRSSAALLRLTIQKLCIDLGLPGKNLNEDIGELVKRGLPVRVQQSLDIVRVIGNNQVHPGVLDVRDDKSMAMTLFELVNYIVENQITGPKEIAALYAKLPETARKQIEERDANANTQKAKP